MDSPTPVADPSIEKVVVADTAQEKVVYEEADGLSIDWTEDEEKRLVRKLDGVVMSLLTLSFLALQYDRGNIGNALTDFFEVDVGIDQSQFNVGQQLLSVGIVILEIPSNLILYRVGPQIWIACQIFAWGIVATFQAFQKGLGAFLSTRLLLGMCESGFIPAGLYTITAWYKTEETSKRFAWYFIGNMLAQATTGLIAYGVLQMRGIGNLAGWQWLFILEGLFTILVGFIFAAFFPKNPEDPKSLLGFYYFNERERHILTKRLVIDDPGKKHRGESINRTEFIRTIKNWRIYPHLLLTILALSPSSPVGAYSPTIVASWGYGRLRSNALASVGQWIQLVTTVSLGFIADKTGRRGFVVFGGLIVWMFFAVGCLVLAHGNDNGARYALLVLAISMLSSWHPVNGSWLAVNARSPGERSITMAMFIMSANCAGIIGSQLFQASDSPRYIRAWTAIVSMVAFGAAIAGLQIIQYWLSNRKIRSKEGAISSSLETVVLDEEGLPRRRKYYF